MNGIVIEGSGLEIAGVVGRKGRGRSLVSDHTQIVVVGEGECCVDGGGAWRYILALGMY